MGNQLWIYGTKGSLNLTLEDMEFFYEPKRAHLLPSKPGAKGAACLFPVHADVVPKPNVHSFF
jgi:hypothetical protein